MKRLFTLIFSAISLFFPLCVFAVTGQDLIPSWVDPVRSTTYQFTAHVIMNGNWQLPPKWAGFIEVYIDATIDGAGIPMTLGTLVADVNTGKTGYVISNPTLATTTGTFSIDIGPQPDGDHNVYIKFWGGTECSVNIALNEISAEGINNRPTTGCPGKSADNFAPGIGWLARIFSVSLPQWPRMEIDPPSMDFSNVVMGSRPSKTFTLENSGQQTLTGSLVVPPPFSCSPSCSYTINPRGRKTLTVIFSPATAPTTFTGVASFSCIGTSLGCDGAPYNGGTPTTRDFPLSGSSVTNAVPPAMSVSPMTVNYSQINIGSTNDRYIGVRNTGGGLLNGSISPFSTPEYSCPLNPSCMFSLFAGEYLDILVRYVPVTVGVHADTATFTGGAGGPISVSLQSVVNDKPIASLYYVPSISFGSNINVSRCVQQLEYVRNIGAGLLVGSVQGVPISTLAARTPGFSCTSGCSYSLTNPASWQTVQFQFCPVDASAVSVPVVFSNTTNVPASATVTLTGQGNILPIASGSATTINFPGTLINTPVTQTFDLTNTGVGILNGTVSPASLFPGVYVCLHTDEPGSTDCSFNIPAGQTRRFTFQFLPTAVQSYNGSSISFLYSDGSWTNVGLNGSGIQPRFQLSYVNYPDLPFTPASSILPPSPVTPYDIGATAFGGALVAQNKKFYLYVKNTGNGASVNYTFHNPSTHYVCLGGATHGCSGVLAPGEKDIIQYEFRPDAPTSFPETIVIDYMYSDGVPHSVNLDVTGESVSAPYLFVTPNTRINLGNVAVGATTSATFSVTNLGFGALNNVAVTFPSLTATDPTAGLVNRWTFDNADTNWSTHTVTDKAGGGNAGHLPGPISAVGKIGDQALEFDGIGSLEVPDASILRMGESNTDFTIGFWMNLREGASGVWRSILQKGNSDSDRTPAMWLFPNSNHIHYRISTTASYNEGGDSVAQIPVGAWTHVAYVKSGNTLSLYLNGVLDSSATLSGSSVSNTGKLYLNSPWYLGVSATFDDVRVYSRALSAGVLSQVMSGLPITSGLSARWTFDSTTVVWSQLKALDTSGNGNDGKLSEIPSSVSGKLGQALSYSGANESEVTTSTYLNNPLNFSIGAWFKSTSASGRKIIGFESSQKDISGSYDRQLYMGSDGKIHFGVFDGSTRVLDSIGVLNDGMWHHVLGTHDSTGLTALYVDGVFQASFNSAVQGFGGYWRIGGYRATGWPYGSDGYFVGSIDDARVYNRALSSIEAGNLFDAGVSGGLSAFTCVSGCAFTNLVTGSQVVEVEFAPTEAIGYIGYPLFSSSNGGSVGYPADPYPSLVGTGVLDALIDLSPMNLSFPKTNLGLPSSKNLVITNSGLGDLSGNVSPVLSGGLMFYCYSNCNFNLAPGGSTTAIIQFSPDSVGNKNGVITVTSNAINTPQVSIPAFGEGTFDPIIDPRGGDTNFGKVVVTKHKSQTFTLDNTNSTTDLGSGTFVVTGPFTCTASDAGFDASGKCLYNLHAGGKAVITIKFSPSVVGGLPATSINTGSVWLSGLPIARFFVQGVGVPPAVRFIED